MEEENVKDIIEIRNITGFRGQIKNSLAINTFSLPSEEKKDKDSVKLMYPSANTIVTTALTTFDKDKKRNII